MFARMVEIFPKMELKEELLKTIRVDVLPILRKQPGFLEILPLTPEVASDKAIVITLWAEKRDADRYVRSAFPKVSDIVKPYLLSPILSRHYTVETSLCPHFAESMAA